MKSNSLQHDDEAFISSLINLVLLLTVIAVVYIAYQFVTGTDFNDLGGGIFDGAIDFASGGLAALFTGPKGIFTSSRTIWSNSKIFGKNPWWGWN
jgi:hypothetical protein